MRRAVVDLLRCPVTRAAYELDPIRTADDEIVEAFLVSRDRRDVRPLFAGIAVAPKDLRAHLRSQGSVYLRSPLHDPRMVRFVRGQAGEGHDAVPFDEVVAHYRDLVVDPPPGYDTATHPADEALDRRLVEALDGVRPERALHVGCSVGRATFVMAAHVGVAVGLDARIARVRRARNIAVTREHFFLPGPRELGIKELKIDLGRLVRDNADFVVANPEALPFADDTFDLVLLDIEGDDAHAEAERVLAPDGRLIVRTPAERAP
ncbi:MAG: methyltransferase domain-containing protein [Planctomycetota bacterium]|nr:methyltransferase domain-containing protein [Planctomycetota bacterium]